MHRLLLTLLVVVAVPAVAAAEPPRREAGEAALLAAGSTAAGVAIYLAGLQLESLPATPIVATAGAAIVLVGPSAGHIYAGERRHAALMSLARAGAVGLAVAGAFRGSCINGACEPDATGKAMFFGGIALVVAGTVYDLVDAPFAARRANRRAALTVAPMVNAGTAGLVIGGGF